MDKRLFQHSTIGALMAGMFEGTYRLDDLLEKGNLGIGTLHGLNGELVIVDGLAYQVTVEGEVVELSNNQMTPYAAITEFNAEEQLVIRESETSESLQGKMLDHFSSENTFQAVKISGTFNFMHCRSVEKQEEPYPRLVEVAEDQAEFKDGPIAGTLVGFYTPEIFGTVSVPGFHLHFLSAEKDFGGHVLDFSIEEGNVEWQSITTLEQHFPVENKSFMTEEIDYSNLKEDIERSE